MVRRCHSPTSEHFALYGARGIKVDPEWRTFVGFLDWALAAGYQAELTLDRIDSDRDYSPKNCRWIPGDLNAARQQLERSGEYLSLLTGKLTDLLIRSRGPSGKALKLTDGGGLHLLVSTTGHRSWRFSYRFGGKSRLLTIGPYPAISILEARERHAIARSQLKRGRDPASIKQETVARRKRARSARVGVR